MSKKIVVLSGSLRKGDGYKIIRAMEENLNQKGKVEFDYVHLGNLEIRDCIGCMKCFDKGESSCPFKEKDELETLVNKLRLCDGIILHSPVYALGVTGTMKHVIDRLAYMFHRPELIAKPVMTIVTTGGGGIKPTMDYLKLVGRGFGCNLVGELTVISPQYFNKNKFYNEKYANKINKQLSMLCNKFYSNLDSKTMPIPSYKDLFMFCGLRSKTYLSKADYDYWVKKGWLKSNYYYEVRISCFKVVFEKALNVLIKVAVKMYMGKSFKLIDNSNSI